MVAFACLWQEWIKHNPEEAGEEMTPIGDPEKPDSIRDGPLRWSSLSSNSPHYAENEPTSCTPIGAAAAAAENENM